MNLSIIITIITLICGTFLIICVGLLIGNNVVYNERCKLIQAVYQHQIETLNNETEGLNIVEYEDLYGYIYCLFRPWCWNHKKMLIDEKYEILKPYIKEV